MKKKLIFRGILTLLMIVSFFGWQRYVKWNRAINKYWIEPETAKIENDFKEISQAYLSSDFDRVRKFLHSLVRVANGANDTYEKRYQEITDHFESDKSTVKEFEISRTPAFYTSGDNDFAIIPTRMIVTQNQRGLDYRLKGFLLGHKKYADSTWKHVDLSSGWSEPSDIVEQYFDEFPEDVRIPGNRLAIDPQSLQNR